MLGKDMYEDVIVILKNIYERNLLVFTKGDLGRVSIRSYARIMFFTFSNRIKNPFLRSSPHESPLLPSPLQHKLPYYYKIEINSEQDPSALPLQQHLLDRFQLDNQKLLTHLKYHQI